MNAEQELWTEARRLGIELTSPQVESMKRYQRLLETWGAKMNLTALDQIVPQLVDSAALVPHVPESARSLVDVGSGAGFPGAVFALLRPGCAVTLVERLQKRVGFLYALRRELGLNFRIIDKGAEQLDERFDVAVSRAVFVPERWVEVGRKLITPGGTLVAMIGARHEELADLVDMRRVVDVKYTLGESHHRIICWTG